MHTEFMNPFGLGIDLVTGDMPEATHHLERFASDMDGYYADSDALKKLVAENDNPLHYEVFEMPVANEPGQLMYCISKLQPGRVGDEFFMTKGHYHEIAGTAEIYLCLGGAGYMLMKTPDGKCAAEEMKRGRMVYVPPYWAHRSVNTSLSEPLVSFCVYPADAGHDYGRIVEEGFGKRIFLRDGNVIVE